MESFTKQTVGIHHIWLWINMNTRGKNISNDDGMNMTADYSCWFCGVRLRKKEIMKHTFKVVVLCQNEIIRWIFRNLCRSVGKSSKHNRRSADVLSWFQFLRNILQKFKWSNIFSRICFVTWFIFLSKIEIWNLFCSRT